MERSSDELIPQTNLESKVDETRGRILEAATQIFAEQGYARATTRAIAAAANVNEVTLFRHFGSKENLFKAIIEQHGAPTMVTTLEAQLTGDYRQDLLLMGNSLAKLLLERGEAVRLMLCEAAHFPEMRAAMAQNPRQLRQMLARYLRRQMEEGKVRKAHPEALAQAFWGMFFSYGIARGILAGPLEPEIPLEELVAQFVDIFVEGTIDRS